MHAEPYSRNQYSARKAVPPAAEKKQQGPSLEGFDWAAPVTKNWLRDPRRRIIGPLLPPQKLAA